MLLRLSFGVDDEEEWEDKDEDESDEGGIRTYDVNAKDAHGNSPLSLACRLGNLVIAEILVCAGKRRQRHKQTRRLLYWPLSGRANSSSLRCSSARVRIWRRPGCMVQD